MPCGVAKRERHQICQSISISDDCVSIVNFVNKTINKINRRTRRPRFSFQIHNFKQHTARKLDRSHPSRGKPRQPQIYRSLGAIQLLSKGLANFSHKKASLSS